jgi:2-C-methyl-D-erythritol 4-phosphate cytidylyltransferase
VLRVATTEDRSAHWLAQTPQVFRCGLLRRALDLPGSVQVTDEAEAIEQLARSGVCARPRIVPGSTQNLKVTYAGDVALAAAILAIQAAEPGTCGGRPGATPCA